MSYVRCIDCLKADTGRRLSRLRQAAAARELPCMRAGSVARHRVGGFAACALALALAWILLAGVMGEKRTKKSPRSVLSELAVPTPYAVVLGVNEIASAVAVHLRRVGWWVAMSHDPFPPVMRRGMAFHDVLYGECVVIEGIVGELAIDGPELLAVLVKPRRVAVTPLHLTDLLPLRRIDAVIDARLQKHSVTPDLRGVARIAVGLGPNFQIGANCDIAVETRPARSGEIVRSGATDAADGVPRRLGGAGGERFVYSGWAGEWRARAGIGTYAVEGTVLGYLDERPVFAPLDGVVRGIVRDGLPVPARVKLLEIDPRREAACWTGIDDRGRGIGEAAVAALRVERKARLQRERRRRTAVAVAAGP